MAGAAVVEVSDAIGVWVRVPVAVRTKVGRDVSVTVAEGVEAAVWV
jgi:hypothetical protein